MQNRWETSNTDEEENDSLTGGFFLRHFYCLFTIQKHLYSGHEWDFIHSASRHFGFWFSQMSELIKIVISLHSKPIDKKYTPYTIFFLLFFLMIFNGISFSIYRSICHANTWTVMGKWLFSFALNDSAISDLNFLRNIRKRTWKSLKIGNFVVVAVLLARAFLLCIYFAFMSGEIVSLRLYEFNLSVF